MKKITISRLTALGFGAFLLGATACGGGGMEGCGMGGAQNEAPPLDCRNGTYEQNGKCVPMNKDQRNAVTPASSNGHGSSTTSSSSNHP